jgi:hypothetical protein
MRPGIDVYLGELARLLGQDFASKLATTYDQSVLTRNAMLLSVVIDEFDKAASRRIEENQAIRRLFADAVTIVPAADLQSRLLAASQSAEHGFRVSELDASNCALRSLLIELHEQVEQMEGDAARSLEDAIWSELARGTERRRTPLNRF